MLNILDLVFLSLAFLVSFAGYTIIHYETCVPSFIVTGFKYGVLSYKSGDVKNPNLLLKAEIPKALYRHFYLFASVFSAMTLIYAFLVYCLNFSVNGFVHYSLKLLLEQDEPSVPAHTALLALSLITLQCMRRCYETYVLQVFAKSSRMNFFHYFAAYIHYVAVVVSAIGQAPLFCGNQSRDKILWNDTKTTVLSIPCVIIFMWAWHEQYMTNVIFANLRKDKKTGDVITEEHKIPHGRLFAYVSSPHRLSEVIIYTVLLFLIPTRTFFCIYLWVLSNQAQTAIYSHLWYKNILKNYPADRKALFPMVF